MARQEEHREDLLAEATALVERIEISAPGFSDLIVLGIRASGALSVFFGQDHAYHFTASGKLRRAYFSGTLLKAEHGRLVALQRERSATEVHLLRRELTAVEQTDLLADLQSRLNQLLAALSKGDVQSLRQQPPEPPLLPRAIQWLSSLPEIVEVADAPHLH